MHITGLNKLFAMLRISPAKLAAIASSGTAANVATATTTVAGTVRQAAAVDTAAAAIPAAAPAGGTGTAAGGWDTAGNRDAAIDTINGLRTAVSELQTQYNALQAAMVTAGLMEAGGT